MRARALLQSPFLADPTVGLLVSIALAAGIAAFDYATEYRLRVGVLYLPPIFLATWAAGRTAGLAIGGASAALWLATLFGKQPYLGTLHHLWEGTLHLVMYAAFVFAIARLKSALELAKERFVSAFDSLEAAAWVVDPESDALLYSNPQFSRTFGAVGSAGGLARRFGAFAPAPPEGEAFDTESGRWFYLLARAMRWLDGRSVRLYVATDITESKRAEQLARKQAEQLERTARLIAVGEMASTLAHELNQPLGAIANYNNGCIRLLRQWSGAPGAAPAEGPSGFDPRELLELMEKCSTQALRAGDVVRRIREFVRRRPPTLHPENPRALVMGALGAAEGEMVDVRLQAVTELPAALPDVAADRVMVTRVMVNLVRNAWEAMQALEEDERRLAVRAREHDTEVEFEFADRGPGVAAEVERQLFQPFVTTKAEGMGLGLAICRSIVEYHRGELWFTRNPEGGTTFHFTLPVARR